MRVWEMRSRKATGSLDWQRGLQKKMRVGKTAANDAFNEVGEEWGVMGGLQEAERDRPCWLGSVWS